MATDAATHGSDQGALVVAHDLGTTGDKASLHDADGRLLCAWSEAYPTRFGSSGEAEQSPDDWWNAVAQTTRGLLDKAGVEPGAVAGVIVSGQMMGAVFLDESLNSLRPSMIWADRRSTEQADRLAAAVGMETAYATLGHRIDPTYSLTKAMWVREHQPEVWARTRHLCLAKDYVNLRLTGLLATDRSDASSTNAYDQRAGEWSTDLLAAAEIDAGLLPPIRESASVLGELTEAAAGHLGLVPGTSVVVGGGDGPMAAVGAGVVAPDDGIYAYLGSSSWVSAAADAPLHDPQMRSMTFNHVVPGRFVPTATMQAGGASLQWVVELCAPGDANAYDRLLAAAADVRAADDGLFFLPHILGERSPYWNPAATGVFVGLSRHHTQPHLVRAVLEGVAFNLRTCLEALLQGQPAPGPIDVIGGGAKSDLWLQILADVWAVPVRRRTIGDEANSLGAAVTALVSLLPEVDFDLARSLSSVSREFSPDSAASARYREQHAIFMSAYRQLEPWFTLRFGAAHDG